MSNQAELFLNSKLSNNNVENLIESLEVAKIHSELWDHNTTLYTFSDDSQVKICGNDVEVI